MTEDASQEANETMGMDERERELAEELERTRDDAGEWSDKSVEIDIQPTRTQVVSFRLPLEELERLTAIAASANETLSEFVREAIDLRIRHVVEPSVVLTHTANTVTVRRSPISSGRNEPDPFYVSELGKVVASG